MAPFCLTTVSGFSRNLGCVPLWTEGDGLIYHLSDLVSECAVSAIDRCSFSLTTSQHPLTAGCVVNWSTLPTSSRTPHHLSMTAVSSRSKSLPKLMSPPSSGTGQRPYPRNASVDVGCPFLMRMCRFTLVHEWVHTCACAYACEGQRST